MFIKYLLISLIIILGVANQIKKIKQNDKQDKQQQYSFNTNLQQQKSIHISKPIIDKKQYHYLKLDNDLKVLVIYDQEIKLTEAALNVNIGSWFDPIQFPGLAHFLEHMLFQGSHTYPNPSYFEHFISKGGGYSNAYTEGMRTNYYFQIESTKAKEALDIFAHFFIDPLFNQEMVFKEANAVNSEYEIYVNGDGWKLVHLLSILSQKEHPLSRFTIGNLDTLYKNHVVKALKQFHKKYYSSNQMALVIRTNIQDMVQYIQKGEFNKIENKQLKKPRINGLPIKMNQQIIKYHTNADRITIFYVYQFDDATKSYLTKPIEFLDSYISSKHKGGLYDYLIKENLIIDMGSQPFYGQNGGFMFYLIIVIVEENQLNNIYKIQQGIINYFKQINIDKLQNMYNNKKDMINMQFKYMEEQQDIFQLSHNLNTYKPKYALNGHEIFRIYNKKIILKYLKQLQNPKNIIVMVGHNKFKLFQQKNIQFIDIHDQDIKFIQNNYVNTNNQLYHLEYQIDNLRQQTLDYINQSDIQFIQPDLNNYIPRNFKFKTLCNQQQISFLQTLNPQTLYHRKEKEFISNKQFLYFKTKKECKQHEFEYEQINLFPQLIKKTLLSSLWWRLDRQFSPMIFVGLRFDSPIVIDTTNRQALLRLFNNYQIENLQLSLHQSLEVGFSFDFDSSVRGLTLQLFGWSDRFQQFYQDLLTTLKFPCNDQQQLNRVKNNLIQTYKNQAENKLYIQARQILKDMLESNPSSSEMIEELQSLNINDLIEFQDQLMNQFRINTLITGNILRREAEKLEQQIHEIFKENKPELSSHYHKTTVYSIGQQSLQYSMFSKSSNQYDNNGVTLNYYQIGSRDKRQYALMTLLQNPIANAAYSYLRTNLQLGYVVTFSFSPVGCIDAAQLLIQGTVEQPYIVNKKIEEFLIVYGRQLREMSDEEFEDLKVTNIQKLKNPFTNLKDKASDIWRHIKNNDLAFEEKEIAISVIETIKKEEMYEFYNKVFNGGKLSLQIYGKGMLDDLSKVNTLTKEQTYATRDEINIDSIDGFHQKLRFKYNCNYRISNF